MAKIGAAKHQLRRSQSAMEYLMTYGWAILIIAVVLGALYSLGVFNAVNFAPKVPGGGCHVFRPNGPGTSWNVNLVGSCNNALPQYVAQFNGQSSYVNIGQVSAESGNNPVSFTVWFRAPSFPSYQAAVFSDKSGSPSDGYLMFIGSTGQIYWNRGSAVGGGFQINATNAIAKNTWYFAAGTYDGSYGYLYVNGFRQATSAYLANPITVDANMVIGQRAGGYTFNGSIANVQIYNTSLTANQVAYLYSEGIGGVPISPQYLVGWWPLNGDVNDYSGNNNNGVPTSVSFNGTWISGYNVP